MNQASDGTRRGVSDERRKEVCDEITALSTPAKSFYLMTALSAIIASYGLLTNSTAVVIGAMLVAPLMGPIFGLALSVVRGDRCLLWRSAVSEVAGVFTAVLLSTLIGLMPLRLGFGSEILSRTQPTIYDLVIAVASGMAGAYALVNKRVSPALPGVAVATALMPPLATCGLCIATARWDWALGAFLLFLGNLLAIEIVAALIFVFYGMAADRFGPSDTYRILLRRFGVSLALLAALAVFMTHTLLSLISDRKFYNSVEASVAGQVSATLGARLSELRYEKRGGRIDVTAVVLTPQEFAPDQVAGMEDQLRRDIDPRIHLMVRSLISQVTDRHGAVFLAEEERRQKAQVVRRSEMLGRASGVIRRKLRQVPGAALTDLRFKSDGRPLLFTAVVRTPFAVEPETVREMERALRSSVGEPVRLTVRSVLTVDTDARGYPYARNGMPRDLSGAELAFYKRVERALENQVRRRIPGATLADFRYGRQGGRLVILAEVRTPRAFEPWQVRAMERAFREYVDPESLLIVRSDVSADTAGSGYLPRFDESKLGP